MEGSRTRTFRIILIASGFLIFGFCLGFYITDLVIISRGNKTASHYTPMGADNIMTKRMQAVKQARRDNKDTYEFEVSGFHPALNK
jgi:hypothetical protein